MEQLQSHPSRFAAVTNDDWERHRITILRLYLNEDKPLKEVMAVMEHEYGFRASVKMYKSRLSKWDVVKNNKVHEMAVILRKKKERDRIGKKSSFSVRGRPVSEQELARYFDRRPGRIPSPSATTPPDILCWSPSPTPSSSLSKDKLTDTPLDLECQSPHPPGGHRLLGLSNVMQESDQYARGDHVNFAEKNGSGITPNQNFSGFLSKATRVPHAISPPQNLMTAERLFSATMVYFDASLTDETWVLDNWGDLVRRHVTGAENRDVYSFFDYFLTGTQLIQQLSIAEGRRLLSNGMELIPNMLRFEHPRMLESILNTLLLLKSRRNLQISAILLKYTSDMARVILPQRHPLHQICSSLLHLDSYDQDVLIPTWRCISDAFTRALGRFSRPAIMCHNNLIRCLYQATEPVREERILRDLLKEGEEQMSGPVALEILLQLGYSLIAQAKDGEAVVVVESIRARSLMAGHFQQDYEGKALDLSATAQYYLGNDEDAERNIRSATDICASLRGVDDSAVLNLKLRLAGWLRDWGRGTEADQLEGEIAEWLEPGGDMDIL